MTKILISRYTKVRWNVPILNRLKSFGYVFTKLFDTVIVKVEHLSDTSLSKVIIKCDICGNVELKTWGSYFKTHRKYGMCTCKNRKCIQKVSEAGCLNKFGVKNSFQLVDRIKESNIKKIWCAIC